MRKYQKPASAHVKVYGKTSEVFPPPTDIELILISLKTLKYN